MPKAISELRPSMPRLRVREATRLPGCGKRPRTGCCGQGSAFRMVSLAFHCLGSLVPAARASQRLISAFPALPERSQGLFRIGMAAHPHARGLLELVALSQVHPLDAIEKSAFQREPRWD